MSNASLKKALLGAVSVLQQASAADTEGNDETASRLYLCAACELEDLRKLMPDDYSSVLANQIESARKRAAMLRDDKVREDNKFPTFPVTFQRGAVRGVSQFVVPQHTVLRPFWLMRVLSRSIQEGAFVTPHLYVTKAVWQQEGANTVVTHVSNKVTFLSCLCELMEDMQTMPLGDQHLLEKALSQFISRAETAKKLFDQEVGKKGKDTAPQRSKLERGFRELLHRGQTVLKSWRVQQDASYNAYLAWAVNAMEQAQTFQNWVSYFAQAKENGDHTSGVIEKLHTIAAFFYFTACQFLIQDMFLLVERHNSLGRESLSRLLPTTVKFEAARSE